MRILCITLGVAILLSSAQCSCPDDGRPSAEVTVDTVDPADRPSALRPPPREPGPPRPESVEQLALAKRESQSFAAAYRAGGIAAREVSAMADIRGYRLFKRRFFGQALAWFKVAIQNDPGFEPALFNGARAAAALGKRARARDLLQRLKKLDTPLARSRLQMARQDRDLAPVVRFHED